MPPPDPPEPEDGRRFATRAERRRAQPPGERADSPPIGMGGSTFLFSLLLTVGGALLPGAALFAAGRRRIGGVLLGLSLLGLIGLIWFVVAGQRAVLYIAVNPRALLLVGLVLPVVALVWAAVVVIGWTSVRPMRTSGLQRAISATVVSLLCLAVVLPTVVASRYALVQRDLVTTVFAAEDRRSATAPQDATPADPWAGQARVNLLLLGGDGGKGRDGVRTDTVILASIDTRSGDTTLFSLPRNLENLPFPPGPLREVYPDGFTAPGDEGETLLNAIYRNVPSLYPDLLGPTDDLGADVLKLGVGEALGLNVDYYMLVNLEGFKQLVDALGGVTVDINTWVPIGGVTDLDQLPDDYLAPGPDQALDGFQALWFARGRFGSSDYERMDRQRCVINAVIDQADPVTLLSRYQSLAATTQDILSTDIPQSLLPAFVDLGLRIKDGIVTSVVFDNDVINPAYPDYDFIRATVTKALTTPPAPPSAPTSSTAPPTSAGPTTPPPDPVDTGTPPAAESLENSCAYDAAIAAAALADGEPPTRDN